MWKAGQRNTWGIMQKTYEQTGKKPGMYDYYKKRSMKVAWAKPQAKASTIIPENDGPRLSTELSRGIFCHSGIMA